MNGEFKVYIDVAPNMLRNPYTASHKQLFGGFSLQVADQSLPLGGMMSGEFLLVLLLHWNKEIHPLAEGKSRSAKLFFTMAEGEIWVRKTAKPLWKVSYIDYLDKTNRIRAEVLCIPERLEAGLLTVSRKVLTGAQKAGIWTPDCAEMERFLRNPAEYMRQYEATPADHNNQGKYGQQSSSVTTSLAHRFSQTDLGPLVNSRFSQPPPTQLSQPRVIGYVDPITRTTSCNFADGPGCGTYDSRHDWVADLGLSGSDRFTRGSLHQTQIPPTIYDPLEGGRQGEVRRQEKDADPPVTGSSVKPSQEDVLRRIARSQLEAHFAELTPSVMADLVVSLTHQWRTNEGHAGLVTPGTQFWFQLVYHGDGGYGVNVTADPSQLADDLRQATVEEKAIADLLHRLNLSLNAVCGAADGRSIRLSMNPRERIITLEPPLDQKG